MTRYGSSADGTPGCVFCDIVNGQAPATVIETWLRAIAIVPLNPLVAGHVIVLPKIHVTDATEQPKVTGHVAACAAALAAHCYGDFNLITSKGASATQSVPHLHWHIVPRREGDGLHLPWTAQHAGDLP